MPQDEVHFYSNIYTLPLTQLPTGYLHVRHHLPRLFTYAKSAKFSLLLANQTKNWQRVA